MFVGTHLIQHHILPVRLANKLYVNCNLQATNCKIFILNTKKKVFILEPLKFGTSLFSITSAEFNQRSKMQILCKLTVYKLDSFSFENIVLSFHIIDLNRHRASHNVFVVVNTIVY